jgi:uncharacterized membrane protein
MGLYDWFTLAAQIWLIASWVCLLFVTILAVLMWRGAK